MNISLESTGNLTANLILQVAPEDYKGKVKEELKKVAKQAKLPGFRPGKVPIGMVRKMAGISLVIEVLNEIVNEQINGYLKENEVRTLGDPMPIGVKTEEDFDLYCEKEMEFGFELGLAPDFEVNYHLSDAPKVPAVEVDDAYLQKEIVNLQDRMADVSTPDEVAEGDMLFGGLLEVDENGEPVEDGISHTIPLNPQRLEKPELFVPFHGKKLKESVPFDPFTIADDHAKIKELTFLDIEDLEEMEGKTFHFEIRRINRISPAELNEEFFGNVATQYGWTLEGDTDEDAVEVEEVTSEEGESGETEPETAAPAWTEEAFKEKFSEVLKADLQRTAEQRYNRDLQDALIDAHQLEMPDEFLKKWMLETGGENMTQEKVEEEYPEFVRGMTWSLLVEKMQKENEALKVESEDIVASIRDNIRMTFAYQGQQLSEQQEMEYMNHFLKDENMVNQHYSRMASEKIFPHLLEKVQPENEAISATDLMEKLEAERKEREEEEAKKIAEQVAAQTQPEAEVEG